MEKELVSGTMLTLLLMCTLTLTVNIHLVMASGTIYIRADGSVDPETAPISTVDNIIYTFTGNINDSIVVERNNIVIDGAGYTIHSAGAEIGIDLSSRSNITIKNMEIEAFNMGIGLYSSSNNSIVGNNLTANNFYGVWLYGSLNNSIVGNNIKNSQYGVWLWASSNNRIVGNTITANSQYGVWLSLSLNNRIYHNSLVNNTSQVYTFGSTNIWDDAYPSGGNYWSNYYNKTDYFRGVSQNETGSDGIADQPYVIDVYDQDNYPLMGPFGPLTMPGENVTVFLTMDVGLIFENVTGEGSTTVSRTAAGPPPPPGLILKGLFYNITTTASYTDKIEVRIIYDGSKMTRAKEEKLQLFHWNETTQDWMDITTSVDIDNNVIYGETSHLSLIGIHRTPIHDINVTEVASKTVVGQDFTMRINATVANIGDFTEDFRIIVNASTTTIREEDVVGLINGTSTTISFIWSTTGFAIGNYIINAYVPPVDSETSTDDNYGDNAIKIGIPGDVDASKKVDMMDIGLCCATYYLKAGQLGFVPNYDIDDNGKIDMMDIGIACAHYYEKET